MEGHIKKSDKTNLKKKKDYRYRERLEKLWLTTFLDRRMRGDLVETFKILNGISKYSKPSQLGL